MADVDTKGNGGIVAAAADGDSHDLKTILAGDERDFLVRNNGDQVKISELDGKIVGLYFSGSWCGPCRRFTPTLVEAYEGLSAKGNFEVIFISSDRDEESFTQYFSKMPWLAIPFSDSTTIKSVKQLFKVRGIPHLVILGPKGNVLSEEGVQIVGDHGVEAYPFSPERMKELEEQEKAAKENQTLTSLLASSSRDFVISSDGTKVPISELEGKMVGLYFSLYPVPGSRKFIKKLAVVYNKLRERGENFEVVTIPLDDKEDTFKEGLGEMPWLSLPFMDKKCFKLIPYFELQTLPTLIIIGPDGKTLTSNVAELIEEHGDQAYPFSPEKLAELAEVEKARLDAQTLESLLVSGELDYVIGKDDAKVPVADLVGKNILFYFSAHWCGPCRAFLPSLIKAYEEIKATDKAFELIFVSSDTDKSTFQDYFSGMPWLALPFEDERCEFLSRKFKILGIPSLVAIGPTGRTVTTEARDLLAEHGSKAYPFTEEHIAAMQARMEEMEKGWPEKVRSASHAEHELVLTRRRAYICDGCNTAGRRRSYYCKECDFDLHPKCYFEEIEVKKDEGEEEEASKDGLVCDGEKDEGKEGEASKDGWVCDGEVCHKVE